MGSMYTLPLFLLCLLSHIAVGKQYIVRTKDKNFILKLKTKYEEDVKSRIEIDEEYNSKEDNFGDYADSIEPLDYKKVYSSKNLNTYHAINPKVHKRRRNTTTIDTNTIDTNTMDQNTIDTNTMNTNTIDISTIDTNTIDTNTINTNTIDTNTMETSTINTSTKDTITIDTNTLDTNTVNTI